MRAAAGMFLGFAFAATGACSAFTTDDTEPSPAPSDAAVEARSDDAPLEATTADGGAEACSWFCDDFEAETWPTPGWAAADEYQLGTIERTSDVYASPSHSLRAVLMDDAGVIPHAIYPRSAFGVNAVRCEVSLRVDEQAIDYATLLRFETTSASTGATHTVSLSDNGNKRHLEFTEDDHVDVLPPIAVATWIRVGIEYRLGAATRLTIDGVLLNQPAASPAADAGAEAFSSLTLRLGLSRNSGGSGGAWVAYYDDVVCDTE